MKKLTILILCILLLLPSCASNGTQNTETDKAKTSQALEKFTPVTAQEICSQIEHAQSEAGISLPKEIAYVPVIASEITDKPVYEVGTMDGTNAYGTYIEYCSFDRNKGYTDTDKYSISMMEIINTPGGYMLENMTTSDWMTCDDPNVYTDGEQKYYIYPMFNSEEGSKSFYIRYFIADNVVFYVTGSFKNFEGDEFTDEAAKEMYDDFQVVSLAEFEKLAQK